MFVSDTAVYALLAGSTAVCSLLVNSTVGDLLLTGNTAGCSLLSSNWSLLVAVKLLTADISHHTCNSLHTWASCVFVTISRMEGGGWREEEVREPLLFVVISSMTEIPGRMNSF